MSTNSTVFWQQTATATYTSAAVSTTLSTSAMAWLGGASFGSGLAQGIVAGQIAGLIGGAIAGIAGGIGAALSYRNFWTGSPNQYDLEPTLLAGTESSFTDPYLFPDDATIANMDSYNVYYKPEEGPYGIDNVVKPGKFIKSPVDGVATSKYTDQVFKIPDGGRVKVLPGGDVKFTNGYGFYDGLKVINKAGWQDAQYFISRGAYYSDLAKKIYGWDILFKTALRIK